MEIFRIHFNEVPFGKLEHVNVASWESLLTSITPELKYLGSLVLPNAEASIRSPAISLPGPSNDDNSNQSAVTEENLSYEQLMEARNVLSSGNLEDLQRQLQFLQNYNIDAARENRNLIAQKIRELENHE